MEYDLKAFHERSVAFFGSRVAAIREDQWHDPTPCEDWDVRELVRHLVYENLWTAPLMRGATLREVGDRFEGEILGEDPKAAWNESARAALDAVCDVDLDLPVNLSRGPTPARQYLFELWMDHVVHAWDLSRAIGADERLDGDMVQALYGVIAPVEDGLKASGVFGPKVEPPEGSDLQTRLLAVCGRVA
jgi:uncharacterized protein (TIGR03086 family)